MISLTHYIKHIIVLSLNQKVGKVETEYYFIFVRGWPYFFAPPKVMSHSLHVTVS